MNTLPQTISSVNQDQAVHILTLAFSTDPVARWIYPEAACYLENFPRFIRAFGGKAFELGTASLTPSQTGAALWLPPGISPDEDQLMPLLSGTVAADRFGDLLDILEQMGHSHPEEPHWYLPMLGVDPVFQNCGHGSALLQKTLKRCDEDGLTAYLESSNPRNLPLYERHGFKKTGVIRAESAPCLYPMIRLPHGT